MQNARYYHGYMDPEVDKCRTRSVGAVIPGTALEMFYCALDNADCRYARSFASDYVCKHSNNSAFAIVDDFPGGEILEEAFSRA